jgi:hypothetical protein
MLLSWGSGHAIAQVATHRGGPGSSPGQVGFVVGKVAFCQVFSESFCFPANFHSTDCSTHLSSGAGTIDQSHPTPRKLKKKLGFACRI